MSAGKAEREEPEVEEEEREAEAEAAEAGDEDVEDEAEEEEADEGGSEESRVANAKSEKTRSGWLKKLASTAWARVCTVSSRSASKGTIQPSPPSWSQGKQRKRWGGGGAERGKDADDGGDGEEQGEEECGAWEAAEAEEEERVGKGKLTPN